METPVDVQRKKENERMTAAVFVAVVVHAILLSLTFSAWSKSNRSPEEKMLDITLVQTKSDKAPEEEDFLAQANQEGGGTGEDATLPSDPFASPTVTPADESMPLPTDESSASASQEDSEVLTSDQSKDAEYASEESQEETGDAINGIAEMISLRQQIALLSAQIDNDKQADAKAKKHTRISASTKEFKYASFLKDWTEKVERVGNLNYPDAALRASLTGRLRLEVVLDAEGNVLDMIVRESSGHQILDDSAKRIVKLASPFDPLPDHIRADTDIMHITRTWFFQGDVVVK